MPGSQENLLQDTGRGENYRAYLLRCWQETGIRPGGKAAWRFALVQTGEESTPRAFSTLDEMVVYLRDQLVNK